MSDSSEAKRHPASRRKLRKQREKGSVASNRNGAGFLGVAVGLGVIGALGGTLWMDLQSLFGNTADLLQQPFASAAEVGLQEILRTLLRLVVPIAGAIVLLSVLAGIIYNGGLFFAMEAVSPKMERISLETGFKRNFGKSAMIETAFSGVRLLIWLIIAVVIGLFQIPDLLQMPDCVGACFFNQIYPIIWMLLVSAILMFIVCAVLDMILQNSIFLDEQKMPDSELKRERKDAGPSPELRKEIRRVRKDMQSEKGNIGVEHATICFYFDTQAIAIQFGPPDVKLPYFVAAASGADAVQEMRNAVGLYGWPVVEHERLSRSGKGRMLGETIADSFYPDFIDEIKKVMASRR